MSKPSERCECKTELENSYREHCINVKAFYRRHNDINKCVPSPDRTNTDGSGESDQESDDCSRLAFNRVVPEETPVNNKHISEQQRITNDAIDPGKEYERVMSNWIQ